MKILILTVVALMASLPTFAKTFEIKLTDVGAQSVLQSIPEFGLAINNGQQIFKDKKEVVLKTKELQFFTGGEVIGFSFARKTHRFYLKRFYLKRFEVEHGEFKKIIASLQAENYLQELYRGNFESSVDNDTVITCDYDVTRGPYSFKFGRSDCQLKLVFP